MHIVALLITALFAAPSFAMEHYTDSLQSETGKAIGGASVAVYLSGTSTLATIYSDNGVTAKTNPFTTNVIDGTFDFYAANGVYDLVFRHAEHTFNDLRTKRISLFDINNFSGDIAYGATFPTDPGVNDLFVLTSDGDTGTCVEGGGSDASLCRYDGVGWVGLVGAGMSLPNDTITTSESAPLKIRGTGGQSTSGINLYQSSTGTPTWRCVISGVEGDCNITVKIDSGNYWELTDSSDNLIVRYTPGGATMLDRITYGANYHPLKSVWLDAGAASTDGTQCAAPTESSNTLVKTWTIVCADNNSGAMYWKLGMPDEWDGGTVTFELQIHQVGASTNTIEIDFAAMCYSHGETISAFASPPTGEQAASITLTADNRILHGTTAAVTVAGTTCAGGDTLFVTGQVDATASNADIATAVEILGVKMEYGVSAGSS